MILVLDRLYDHRLIHLPDLVRTLAVIEAQQRDRLDSRPFLVEQVFDCPSY